MVQKTTLTLDRHNAKFLQWRMLGLYLSCISNVHVSLVSTETDETHVAKDLSGSYVCTKH